MQLTDVEAELSAFDQGAATALRALAESFENQGMTLSARVTRRALAVVEDGPAQAQAPRCRFCGAVEGVTSHAGGCQPDEPHLRCPEKCSAECPAPVFDDEEFYDGHLDYDGDDQ